MKTLTRDNWKSVVIETVERLDAKQSDYVGWSDMGDGLRINLAVDNCCDTNAEAEIIAIEFAYIERTTEESEARDLEHVKDMPEVYQCFADLAKKNRERPRIRIVDKQSENSQDCFIGKDFLGKDIDCSCLQDTVRNIIEELLFDNGAIDREA